jgi:hypothetical protein
MIHQLLQRQPKFPLLLLLLTYIPAILFLFTIKFQTVVPVHHLTRDPAAVMDAPMYAGFLSNFILLAFALIFFDLSVMIDVADMTFGDDYDGNIYEDGIKFLGIVSWVTYFSITAYKLVSVFLVLSATKRKAVEY